MFYYTHFLTNTIIKLEIIKKKLPVKPLHFTSKRFSKSISIMQNLLKTSSRRISSQKMAFDVFETKTKAEASPLLILHGLFGSKSNWKNVAKILQKTLKPTRKIYTMDIRNHGESFHSTHMNTELIANDIKHFIVSEKLKKFCILGFSMGGKGATHFTLENPNCVEKAIIVDSSPVESISDFEGLQQIVLVLKNTRIPREMTLSQGRQLAAANLQKVITDANSIKYIINNLKKCPYGDFQWICNIDAIWNYLNGGSILPPLLFRKKFNGPTLIIAAGKVTFLNLENPTKVQQIFPVAQIEWFDCTHAVHLEKPVKFVKTVVRFLGK